jgi:hypothetical protein
VKHPIPIHPYAIEFAKLAPHFLIMGLGAMVWYNQSIGDSPIIDYLWLIISKRLSPHGPSCGPFRFFSGLVSHAVASAVRVYRFDAPMLMREKAEMILDATLTSSFRKRPLNHSQTAQRPVVEFPNLRAHFLGFRWSVSSCWRFSVAFGYTELCHLHGSQRIAGHARAGRGGGGFVAAPFHSHWQRAAGPRRRAAKMPEAFSTP